LYITPVIYLYLEKVQEWMRGEQRVTPVRTQAAVQ
jgi:hypothetical protein